MTVVMLLKNTLTAFKIMNGIKDEWGNWKKHYKNL
jgi:hypothetical protein